MLADQLQVLILISLKMRMDSAKNGRWIIPFGRLRVKICSWLYELTAFDTVCLMKATSNLNNICLRKCCNNVKFPKTFLENIQNISRLISLNGVGIINKNKISVFGMEVKILPLFRFYTRNILIFERAHK